MLALVPAESSWIVYVDLDALRSSPLRNQIRNLTPDVPEEPEYKQFVAATGFDYSRDLDRALITFLPAGGNLFQVVAFAEGRFDQERIKAYARGRSRQESHQGRELFVASAVREPSGGKGARQILFAFLDARRVAVADVPTGSSEQLAAARDLVAGNREAASTGPATVASRLRRSAGAPLVASGDPATVSQLTASLRKTSPIAGQLQTLLDNLQWLTLAARPEQDGLRVSLLGECDSAWKAGQIAVVLDALRMLGRGALDQPRARGSLSAEQAVLLQAVLQTSTVKRDQDVVEVRLQIPYALLSPPATAEPHPPRTQSD